MKRLTLVLAGLSLALLAAIPGRAQGPEPARFDWFEYAGDDTTFNFPAGPSEYRNPILSGFYSDPSITRVGDDYYLTASTFTYFPGLPVFRSRDLVHWTQIGNAIDRPGQLNFDGAGPVARRLRAVHFAPRRHVLHRQYLRGLRRQFHHHGEKRRWPMVRSDLDQRCQRHRSLALCR